VGKMHAVPVVFPNPARNTFTLRISENMLAEKPLAELFTLEGRLISLNKLLKTETIFNVHTLNPGIYLLRISSAGENYRMQLVIGE
jgi:hypothetical protein